MRQDMKRSINLINDKVQITRGNGLTLQEALFVPCAAHAPAGLLHSHQLLYHFLFIGIQEVRELFGVE
jgi:hypothetical protein